MDLDGCRGSAGCRIGPSLTARFEDYASYNRVSELKTRSLPIKTILIPIAIRQRMLFPSGLSFAGAEVKH
ncbi:hypothetical protein CHISP_1087 [Chitinispirillum alkaliphilum]|nr:hypothetical protein CHISP_1087 [Chitinispirillum alkaliphilum]